MEQYVYKLILPNRNNTLLILPVGIELCDLPVVTAGQQHEVSMTTLLHQTTTLEEQHRVTLLQELEQRIQQYRNNGR